MHHVILSFLQLLPSIHMREFFSFAVFFMKVNQKRTARVLFIFQANSFLLLLLLLLCRRLSCHYSMVMRTLTRNKPFIFRRHRFEGDDCHSFLFLSPADYTNKFSSSPAKSTRATNEHDRSLTLQMHVRAKHIPGQVARALFDSSLSRNLIARRSERRHPE